MQCHEPPFSQPATDTSMNPNPLLTLARLPARLDFGQSAALLGFREHDIPILVRARLLKPLGNPAANCVKYFSSAELVKLTNDESWLARATKAVNEHWRQKNRGAAGNSTSAKPC